MKTSVVPACVGTTPLFPNFSFSPSFGLRLRGDDGVPDFHPWVGRGPMPIWSDALGASPQQPDFLTLSFVFIDIPALFLEICAGNPAVALGRPQGFTYASTGNFPAVRLSNCYTFCPCPLFS